MRGLTDSQGDVLDFLIEHFAHHGHAPTHHEICENFDWTSPNYPQRRLKALEKKGFIEIKKGEARGITLCLGKINLRAMANIAQGYASRELISQKVFP